MRAVTRGHNLGRTRVVEMRAPVSHHAIAAVWAVASATVSYDSDDTGCCSVSGRLFMATTKRFLGESVSMAFGMRRR